MNSRRNINKNKGYSLAEIMVASVIIGVVGLSAMRLFGGLARSRAEMGRTQLAQLLVLDLIGEIKQRNYLDENNNKTLLGLDTGETGTNRNGYDDVDDYTNLVETPPKFRNGTSYANASDLIRRTTVQWITSANFSTLAASDEGYKKVTIVVGTASRELARSEFIVANARFDVRAYYGY